MLKICLHMKDNPEQKSKQQIIEFSRIPNMGEFIDLGYNLYRVFLVCHSPYNAEYQATVAAVKTDWHSCETLIDQSQRL